MVSDMGITPYISVGYYDEAEETDPEVVIVFPVGAFQIARQILARS
jgi:hypothetical protein